MAHCWCFGRNCAPSLVSVGKKNCPIFDVSGKNSALLFVSLEGIVPLHWCQWGGGGIMAHCWCFGRNCAPSLVSVGKNAPSLMSVERTVPYYLCHWKELCP
ncbi:unnamed protein product, partial [Staurois parvus]